MTVSELIEKLQKVPPDWGVKTWDCLNDCETEHVVVTHTAANEVFVASFEVGELA